MRHMGDVAFLSLFQVMPMDKSEFEDFTPFDFLEFATEINCNIQNFDSSSSSVKRVVFSRVYYAVFLFLRETLSHNTEYISNPYGEHRRLPNFIESRGPFENELNHELSDYVRTLKRLRHQSDYFIEVPLEATKEYDDWLFHDTGFAINLANKIITQFENQFKNS